MHRMPAPEKQYFVAQPITSLPSPMPPSDDGLVPVDLIRKLQRGLSQLGCYSGPMNGQWDAPTRRGMGAFIARANARLPFDKPDIVLLALVQAGTKASGRRNANALACTPDADLATSKERTATEGGMSIAPDGPLLPEQKAAGSMGLGGPPLTSSGGSRNPQPRSRRASGYAAQSEHTLFVHPLGQL